MNSEKSYAVPARLNLFIAVIQITILLTLIRCARDTTGWWLFLVAMAYGVTMNSGYAMLHEAEHGILHRNRSVNDFVGALLALFFPAPFHLIRQGHLGHHLRNRSDDEAFDFYFEGESRVWRHLQLYGILTGLFWLVVVLSNLIAIFRPSLLRPDKYSFDRATTAVLVSLNRKFLPLVRIEALAVVLLHGGLIWYWHIPILHWFVTLSGFGILWSAIQYVHHFGTERDVAKGARNLRTFPVLDWIWLNHNWHLRHHLHPTVPWIHLPRLHDGAKEQRGRMMPAYLRMWRGPRFTDTRVENRYAGRLIR